MWLTIRDYFLFFILYSIIGWTAEVIYAFIYKRKFTNRGFMLGPICPIYGFGALAILILLKPYITHPLGFFVLAMVVCSIIEYIAGYLLEKFFKARWWDYSNTKFNLNGRVCLDTLIPFGIGALAITYLIHPFILSFYNKIPSNILTITSIVIAVLFLADLLTSFNIVNNFKKTIKQASLSDRTEDINNYIKQLFNTKKLHRRLTNAFPNLKAKIGEKISEIIPEKKD